MCYGVVCAPCADCTAGAADGYQDNLRRWRHDEDDDDAQHLSGYRDGDGGDDERLPPGSPPPAATLATAMARLHELLCGMGDLSMSLGEAILGSHRIDQADQIEDLKGDFLYQVLETTEAVARALRWCPSSLTKPMAKLAANSQKAKEFVAGVTRVTDGVSVSGATADLATAGTKRSLLDPGEGAPVAALALKDLAAAEKFGMERWRIDRALTELLASTRLASESVTHAAQAFVIIDEFPLPELLPGITDADQPRPFIKSAKRVMRDALMWRCIGVVLGMDSPQALDPIFQTQLLQASKSQLVLSFQKIQQSTVSLLTGVKTAVGTAKRARGPRKLVENADGRPPPELAAEHAPAAELDHAEFAPPPGLTSCYSGSAADHPGTLAAILLSYRGTLSAPLGGDPATESEVVYQ